MADTGSSIFNKSARERLKSPDDLDKYVRVTNPTVWLVLAACLALLVGLLSWGVFGTVSTSISATGTQINGQTLSLVNPGRISQIKEGDPAVVSGTSMAIDTVSSVPISRSEARDLLGSDWLVSSLMEEDWAYVVTFTSEKPTSFAEGTPLPVTITTERIAPISLVLGKD